MKRTFGLLQADNDAAKPSLIDLSDSPVKPKRARLHSPPLLEKSRHHEQAQPEAREEWWANNEHIVITEHRLHDEWWEFKVVHPSDNNCSAWLRHASLQHLAVFRAYLDRNELTRDEVSEPQYIPERIIDHHYNEEDGEVEFLIAWRGYSADYNSWEPAQNLIQNTLYLDYCKQHAIKPLESICSQLSQSIEPDAATAIPREEDEDDDDNHEDDDDDGHDYAGADDDATASGDCKSEDGAVEICIDEEGAAEHKTQKPEEEQEEDEETEDEEHVEVVMDVMNEYAMAQTQPNSYSPTRIEVILRVIEVEMERIFNAFDSDSDNNSHNHNNSTQESQIEQQIYRYLDVRSFFEELKNELLFTEFQREEQLLSNDAPHDVPNDNDDDNEIIVLNNDDDIVVLNDAVVGVDMNVEHAMDTQHQLDTSAASNSCHSPPSRRRTLFDYSFTPEKCANSNTETKTNADPNATLHRLQAPRQYVLDEEDVPLENIARNNFCYACKRKWNICNVELLRAFPLCARCPTHSRVGYNRQMKEDWFCSYCIHRAQCVLFHTFEHGDDYQWLQNVCDMQPTVYLYIKPNDSAYWKTYIPREVMDATLGTLALRGKTRKHDTVVTLPEIDAGHILWACNDGDAPKLTGKDMSKIDSINDDGTVCVTNKHTKVQQTVPLQSAVFCATYFTKWCGQLTKWCKGRRVALDKARLFRYSRFVQSQKQKKRKFGYDAKVLESAPLNSRLFGGAEEDVAMGAELVPYSKTEGELLAHLQLEQVPAQYVRPPQRRLFLRDIARYPLTLIVGESGCGKSTLLRQLHRENPTQTTFKSAHQLQWHRERSVISHFSDISVDDAMAFMSSIGLNNVRTWLKPFHILSQGEQYRVAFARLLKESQCEPNQVVLIDEFSSVLDRTNARCMSLSIAKCIRAQQASSARFVLASANADIIRYLQPDLVILLGDDDDDDDGGCEDGHAGGGMQWLENPNLYGGLQSDSQVQQVQVQKRRCLLDVKVVLDLPPFALKKADRVQTRSKPLNQCMTFDVPLSTPPMSVDREVRQLQCQVAMDEHTTATSQILDVYDFNGVTKTHIPYLSERDIYGNDGASVFQIGVMLGPSGCGKTTSGERLFGRPDAIEWDESRTIASHFQCYRSLMELFEVCALSLHLAFSRFHFLSEGEKHRVNIARCLQRAQDAPADRVTLIDEFTSFLDRETAVIISQRISDYIYSHGLQNIVFLCCKYDVISARNGLHPSWIFDVQNKKMYHYKRPAQLQRTTQLQSDDAPSTTTHAARLFRKHSFIEISDLWNVPKIRLVLRPCEWSDFDPTFSKYHYMDANINPSSACYSVWAYFTYESPPPHQQQQEQRQLQTPSSPEQKQPPQSATRINHSKLEMDDDDEMYHDSDDNDDDDDDDDEGTRENTDDHGDAHYKEDELQLVGFTSMIHHFGKKGVSLRHDRRVTYDFRETRTVILPSFQGIGFGSRIADCLGEYLALHGCRLHSKTAHPRYGGYRDKQPSLWMATADSGKIATRCIWDDIDRCVYETHEIEKSKKRFYIHVYKLPTDPERDDAVERKLQQRVILSSETKKYANLRNET